MLKNSKKQIVLETERLVLMTPNITFGKLLLDFLKENKSHLQPWSPIAPKQFYTLAYQDKSIQAQIEKVNTLTAFRFYLFKKNEPAKIIGDFAFTQIIRGVFLSCFLSYKMAENECRKGYMKEALKAGIQFIFEQQKLHRIEANILPRNVASIELVKSLGFENEGLAKKYLKINGKWEDHFHYVLLNNSL